MIVKHINTSLLLKLDIQNRVQDKSSTLPNSVYLFIYLFRVRRLTMPQYLLAVSILCSLGAVVHGRAVVSPRKQAELMVSRMEILSVRNSSKTQMQILQAVYS